MSKWNLEESLDIIRNLQPKLTPIGWYIGLTGSVLLKGESSKDLDLVFYPTDNGKINKSELHSALNEFGWQRQCGHQNVHKVWKKFGSSDSKHVEIWKTKENKRIDIFLLT